MRVVSRLWCTVDRLVNNVGCVQTVRCTVDRLVNNGVVSRP